MDKMKGNWHTVLFHTRNVFQPIQLEPIFHRARPKQPFNVSTMNFGDFIDFKSLSKDLRILDAKENTTHWNEIMELRVYKTQLNVIFYKTSHTRMDFNEIKLKRLKQNIEEFPLKMLNNKPNNISKEKWEDLRKLYW